MLKRFASAAVALILLLSCASAYAADTGLPEEFDYTVYLNIAPAYLPKDKAAGRAVSMDFRVYYDPDAVELISDYESDFAAVFPCIGESNTIVNESDGALFVNYLSLKGYTFDSDDDVLAALRFRYKDRSRGRAEVRFSLNEAIVEESSGAYAHIVKNGIFLRDGIRVGIRRSPDIGAAVRGDADSDGDITAADASCIQRRLNGIYTDSYCEEAADADGDGIVTLTDATCIQRYTVYLPTSVHIGEPLDR